MKLARLAVMMMAMSLMATDSVQAESKWSWKKLVPSFGKKESAPNGLYPKSNGPSVFTKMNNGTKSLLAKSKAAVPSWLMPETQGRVRKSSDSLKQGSDRVKDEVRTARRNILAPWGQTENKSDKPETVSDWLANPRP